MRGRELNRELMTDIVIIVYMYPILYIIQGHLRVGKALKGLGEMDYALRAFINCYRDLDRNEAESVKTEVMTELTGVCFCIPRNKCKLT